ncbi:MAG TPA: NAD(P)/FAD-dependent oxidoreductase [Mycobacteriales bacterium]|nr:NAD(P)/FAD-dependent oxidoreductase [Mycobacteriales bacterium]
MPDAVVIGAGPGGLAAAATLRGRGVDTEVVDRADSVASTWRGHYDRLHLHTVRWLSSLPGYPIPKEFGSWVARDDVVRYLEAYAAHHRIEPSFGTVIERVDRDGDRWRLRSPQGERSARHVVVATGYNNTPFVPDWAGVASFQGELRHAGTYRNATPYVGKDVLVVGAGNTGAEIAIDLVETGAARVRIAIRTPPHIVYRELNGVPNQVLGVLFRYAPSAFFDPVAKLVRKLTFGDLAPYGLPMPDEGLYARIRRDDAIPMLDIGFVELVKAGKIEVVATPVGFGERNVRLADGSVIEPEVVIAATGYRRGLEPLVGHLGVLRPDGRPAVHGAHCHPAAPGLWFTGFTNPMSGMFRELAIDARRIARAVARKDALRR